MGGINSRSGMAKTLVVHRAFVVCHSPNYHLLSVAQSLPKNLHQSQVREGLHASLTEQRVCNITPERATRFACALTSRQIPLSRWSHTGGQPARPEAGRCDVPEIWTVPAQKPDTSSACYRQVPSLPVLVVYAQPQLRSAVHVQAQRPLYCSGPQMAENPPTSSITSYPVKLAR